MNSSSDSYFSYPSEEDVDYSSISTSMSSGTVESNDEPPQVVIVAETTNETANTTAEWKLPVPNVKKEFGTENIVIHPSGLDHDSKIFTHVVQQIKTIGLDQAYVYISNSLWITLDIRENVKLSNNHLHDVLILSPCYPPILLNFVISHESISRRIAYGTRLVQRLNAMMRIETKQDTKFVLFEIQDFNVISKDDIESQINEEWPFSNPSSMEVSEEKYVELVHAFITMTCFCRTADLVTTQLPKRTHLSTYEFHILTDVIDGTRNEVPFETNRDSFMLKLEIAARMSRKGSALLLLEDHEVDFLDAERISKEFPRLVTGKEDEDKNSFKYIISTDKNNVPFSGIQKPWFQAGNLSTPEDVVNDADSCQFRKSELSRDSQFTARDAGYASGGFQSQERKLLHTSRDPRFTARDAGYASGGFQYQDRNLLHTSRDPRFAAGDLGYASGGFQSQDRNLLYTSRDPRSAAGDLGYASGGFQYQDRNLLYTSRDPRSAARDTGYASGGFQSQDSEGYQAAEKTRQMFLKVSSLQDISRQLILKAIMIQKETWQMFLKVAERDREHH